MFEGLLTLFHPRSPLLILRDVVDVGVVAYVIYLLLLLLRGTRAMQVGLGLGVVVVVYLLAQRLGLATAYGLLDRFLASFLLLVVVIFQSDIRRALMRVGDRPLFLRWRKDAETDAVEEVIGACTLLAQRRIGALVVFERDASLEDFVAQGTVLDAAVTRELLYTVFLPGYENPLHDGALILRNARVWKAGAFLPLTNNPSLDRAMGTRHRAALGISEETDAVVVIVSEERGQISLCFSGNIVRGLDAQTLRQALYGLFYPKRRAAALLKTATQREEREERAKLSVLPGGIAPEGKPAPKERAATDARHPVRHEYPREGDPRVTTMRGPRGSALGSQGADRTGAHVSSAERSAAPAHTEGGPARKVTLVPGGGREARARTYSGGDLAETGKKALAAVREAAAREAGDHRATESRGATEPVEIPRTGKPTMPPPPMGPAPEREREKEGDAAASPAKPKGDAKAGEGAEAKANGNGKTNGNGATKSDESGGHTPPSHEGR